MPGTMNAKSIPKFLPTSPMTLQCPSCGAKPGHDCKTPAKVRLYVVHLARVKAAAKMDKDARNHSHPAKHVVSVDPLLDLE
jgi:hypothetical protein